jgi:TPR repeat protein
MKLYTVFFMIQVTLLFTSTVSCSRELSQELSYEQIEWLILNNFDEYEEKELISLLDRSRKVINEMNYEYLKHYIFIRSSEKNVILQLKKAFELGHKEAGYNLYNLLILNDKALAEKYLVEAAKRGSAEAMFLIGVYHDDKNERYINHYSKKEMFEMLIASALEGQTQAILSLGKQALNSEVFTDSDGLLWRIINFLVNQDGKNRVLIEDLEANKDWTKYCLNFNKFMAKNFDLLVESTETPERDKYLLLSKSIMECMN